MIISCENYVQWSERSQIILVHECCIWAQCLISVHDDHIRLPYISIVHDYHIWRNRYNTCTRTRIHTYTRQTKTIECYHHIQCLCVHCARYLIQWSYMNIMYALSYDHHIWRPHPIIMHAASVLAAGERVDHFKGSQPLQLGRAYSRRAPQHGSVLGRTLE